MDDGRRPSRHATPRGSAPRPSGGIGGKAGQGAAQPPKASVPRRSGADRPHSDVIVRRGIVAGIFVAAALLVLLLAYLVLSYTPAFTIESVETTSTEHIDRSSIRKLAKVPKGATLLNLDEDRIASNLKKNPWVGSVSFQREFPGTLRIEVRERKVDALVVMSAGDVVWYLGDGNVWIEPAALTVGKDQTIEDVALADAKKRKAMLITEVPATIEPIAGSVADSDELDAVSSYRDQFGDDLNKQIVCFSASSVESVSCTLSSGVEISLGSPTNIEAKEAVIERIVGRYAGKLTYINVRTPSQPSYRVIDSKYVEQGSGTSGTEFAGQDASGSDASGSDASTSDASSSDASGSDQGSGSSD